METIPLPLALFSPAVMTYGSEHRSCHATPAPPLTNVLSGCAPLMVQFGNESATMLQFFSGASREERRQLYPMPDPVITFNAAGNYSVRLISGNAAGSDTTTQNLTIEAVAQSALTSLHHRRYGSQHEKPIRQCHSFKLDFPRWNYRTGNNLATTLAPTAYPRKLIGVQ